jgi:hypothetical protein
MCPLLDRRRFLRVAAALTGALALRPMATDAAHGRPALLVYDSVQELLAGDLVTSVSVERVRADLDRYPAARPITGVGTTGQPLRTGEVIVTGSVGGAHLWWADPDSPSRAAVSDLLAGSATSAPRLPFLAVGIGDREGMASWKLRDVADVHAWLRDELRAAGIGLAALRVDGRFRAVKTTVSYNIPATGLDLSGGYTGDDYFRFVDYGESDWTLSGVYAAPPALMPLISTPGAPLHLHGVSEPAATGGHITSAAVLAATAHVWPLDEVVARIGTVAHRVRLPA